MKSKTSFFNKGVFNSIVKRYWPAWALYAFVWLMAMPIQFLSGIRYSENIAAAFVSRMQIVSGEVTVVMAFACAIITATGVFSFMYKQRENSMVAALPVKREAVFGSAFLAGLLPLTVINVVVAALTLLTAAGHINGDCMNAVLIWLGTYTLEFIAFYGVACFIAMLTGSIVALPVLYVIFNFLAIAIETVIRELINVFVYGVGFANVLVTKFLCPALYITEKTNVYYKNGEAVYSDMLNKVCPQLGFEGWGIIAIYAAVGVVLTACAVLLYRKRRMECTGDVIAIPVLKPVFKYGVAICAAISFGLLIFLIFGDNYNGAALSIGSFIGMIVSMTIGGAVGYFGADMLLKKSVHVFKGNWKGFGVIVAVCILLCLGCRFDVFGMGRYVPNADDIKCVKISGIYADTKISDAETVKEAIALHKSIVADLDGIAAEENAMFGESPVDYYNVRFEYTLKNGRVIQRYYNIRENRPETKQYIELMESEAVHSAYCEQFSKYTAADVANSSISYHLTSGEWYSCDLTAEQAFDLYKNGLAPDIEAGSVRTSYVENEGDAEPPFIWIEFNDSYTNDYMSLDAVITPDCTNTVQWFKDNLGVDITGSIEEPIVNEAFIESIEYNG